MQTQTEEVAMSVKITLEFKPMPEMPTNMEAEYVVITNTYEYYDSVILEETDTGDIRFLGEHCHYDQQEVILWAELPAIDDIIKLST